MWLMAPNGGFYSAVQKKDSPTEITVRARNQRDIEALAEIITGAEPYTTRGTDYPWRLKCTVAQWAEALALMALDVTYSNYKDHVKKVRGKQQAAAYGRVWGALLSIEDPGKRGVYSQPLPRSRAQTSMPLDDTRGSFVREERDRHLDDNGECTVCGVFLCRATSYCVEEFDEAEAQRQRRQTKRAKTRSRAAGEKTQPKRASEGSQAMNQPGKFETCRDPELGERLHAMSLEAGCDEEIVLVDGDWFALIRDAIAHEDEYGNFTYALFQSEAHAVREWESFKAQCQAEGEIA